MLLSCLPPRSLFDLKRKMISRKSKLVIPGHSETINQKTRVLNSTPVQASRIDYAFEAQEGTYREIVASVSNIYGKSREEP